MGPRRKNTLHIETFNLFFKLQNLVHNSKADDRCNF